ncbi:membrane protein [Spirosoma aerophilum]
MFQTPSPDCIDGSWTIGLSLARILHLRFGTDLVFTYGPLGFLYTRLPIATQRWEIVAFDVWMLLQSGFVIWVVLKNRFTAVNLAGTLVIVLFLHNADGMEMPFVLFFFSQFVLCYHLETAHRDHPKTGLVLYAGAISLFAFYAKASVGLVIVALYILYVIYWVVTRRQRLRWSVVMLGAFLTALIGTARYLNTDLIPYVLTNIQIIHSYNDVMVLAPNDMSVIYRLIAAVVSLGVYGLLLLFWVVKRWIKKAPMLDTLFIIMQATLMLFILFKEGFVRAEDAHTQLFFKYAPLPLILLIVFAQPAWFRNAIRIPLALIVGFWVLARPFSFALHQPAQLAMYVSGMTKPSDFGMASSQRLLPQRWQELIRPASVDVLPDAIGLLYTNHLTEAYRPRPIFQSYQVTNRYLDNINATFYRSGKRPTYLIYTHSATNERYAFADEVCTKIAMMKQYAVADQQQDWVLLQSRTVPLNMDTTGVTTQTGRVGVSISITPTPGVQLVQIKVHHTWLGKLSRLLVQPPSIKLEMDLEDGTQKIHRIGTTLLENGLICNRYVKNNAEFVQYMQSMGRNGQTVRSLRLVVSRYWAWGFDPSFDVVFTNLKVSLSGKPGV